MPNRSLIVHELAHSGNYDMPREGLSMILIKFRVSLRNSGAGRRRGRGTAQRAWRLHSRFLPASADTLKRLQPARNQFIALCRLQRR